MPLTSGCHRLFFEDHLQGVEYQKNRWGGFRKARLDRKRPPKPKKSAGMKIDPLGLFFCFDEPMSDAQSVESPSKNHKSSLHVICHSVPNS